VPRVASSPYRRNRGIPQGRRARDERSRRDALLSFSSSGRCPTC
jgi:hypothetical protein